MSWSQPGLHNETLSHDKEVFYLSQSRQSRIGSLVFLSLELLGTLKLTLNCRHIACFLGNEGVTGCLYKEMNLAWVMLKMP